VGSAHCTSSNTSSTAWRWANASALASLWALRPPSFTPRALAAASASLVRLEMTLRSCSASAAQM
jgi:hypothetical protein